MKFYIHILLVVLFLCLANAEMGATAIGNNNSEEISLQLNEVNFLDVGNTTPTLTTDYYPFGMPFKEATGYDKQPYKYNDKEFDTMLRLNLYDYLARLYDPAVGRFTTMDPLAEKYYSTSPYAYCLNNPVKYIDPTGKIIVLFNVNSSFKTQINN